MEGRSFIGPDGFATFVSRWTEDFEGLIDAGDDRVVGSFRQFGIGKESGAAVEQEYFIVYDVADRQLVRMRAFLDRGQALEAAGLRE
ncbi:MAG TPA: hypothetical protein VKA47_11000 [Solirubrobacterales bacterium]|nr:hypothetical protein [Solirubrobacterales bacterium]